MANERNIVNNTVIKLGARKLINFTMDTKKTANFSIVCLSCDNFEPVSLLSCTVLFWGREERKQLVYIAGVR